MGTPPHPPDPLDAALDELLVGEPRRLRWDFAPSRWNLGTLAVEYYGCGQIVCYAPPGTSLRGERGAEVGGWRRGIWSHETHFYERAAPDTVEQLPVAGVRDELPNDFHSWAMHETAAHVERLRTFARRRPQSAGVSSTALRLLEELDFAFPHALERHWLRMEEETQAFQAALAPPPPEPLLPLDDRLRRGPLRRCDWVDMLTQASALGVLYLFYRLALRPEVSIVGAHVRFDHLMSESLRTVLLWVYGAVHVAVAFVFLAWVYFRRHNAYAFVRNTFLVATGLTIFVSYGMSIVFGVPIHDGRSVVAIPAAAVPVMPVVHLVGAAVIGYFGVLLTRSRAVQLLWLAYPMAVVYVIASTPPSDLTVTLPGGAVLTLVAALTARYASGLVKPAWEEPQVLKQRRRTIVGRDVSPASRASAARAVRLRRLEGADPLETSSRETRYATLPDCDAEQARGG